MLNFLMFFFIGFATCFAIGSILWMAWAEDYEAQIRAWRKDAIAAKSDATFWQNAYAKDANK